MRHHGAPDVDVGEVIMCFAERETKMLRERACVPPFVAFTVGGDVGQAG